MTEPPAQSQGHQPQPREGSDRSIRLEGPACGGTPQGWRRLGASDGAGAPAHFPAERPGRLEDGGEVAGRGPARPQPRAPSPPGETPAPLPAAGSSPPSPAPHSPGFREPLLSESPSFPSPLGGSPTPSLPAPCLLTSRRHLRAPRLLEAPCPRSQPPLQAAPPRPLLPGSPRPSPAGAPAADSGQSTRRASSGPARSRSHFLVGGGGPGEGAGGTGRGGGGARGEARSPTAPGPAHPRFGSAGPAPSVASGPEAPRTDCDRPSPLWEDRAGNPEPRPPSPDGGLLEPSLVTEQPVWPRQPPAALPVRCPHHKPPQTGVLARAGAARQQLMVRTCTVSTQ
ncbi:basic proline-rich protein-like [Elephas maximus indicus]|uniref:basic proline-rich protein-like n=1 Tax=Elephas maximus indicus TaxID=99487 RepID=UPI0021165231|nr:basic proline-rich protein-like [Elephas maximus indicus]